MEAEQGMGDFSVIPGFIVFLLSVTQSKPALPIGLTTYQSSAAWENNPS